MIFCRKNRPRAVLASVIASTLLACAAAPASAPADEARDRAQIGALFQKTLVDGYQALDANQALSIYGPDARVYTRLYGELALEPFREIVAKDIGRFKELKATALVENLALAGNEATATVTLQQQGTLKAGGTSGVAGKYYYRLRRAGDTWKIVLQSYRADLSVPPAPGQHPDVEWSKEKKPPPRKFH